MSDKIRDIVKDKEWQKVRVSLLGQWSENPERCCGILKKYMGKMTSITNVKLRIVMNYLTGTGFRTGKIKHKCISAIRKDISGKIKIRKMKGEWV